MRNRLNRRVAAAAGAGISLTLMLAACGADQIEGSGGSGDGASGEAAGGSGVDPALEIDCAPYEEFGDLEGTEVSLYTSILAPEDQPYIDAFAPFTECTGVEVTYEGSSEFEAQLLVRTQAGNPPDIALFPQPGLLQTIVRDTGTVVPAPDQVEAAVDEFYGEDWKNYGTVDGEFYAAPNSANVKSFVWYSPSAFEEAGYEVPETWDDMLALSDQIVADNPDGEIKPWCAGIESGDATGWTATDWMEDVMLRTAGPRRLRPVGQPRDPLRRPGRGHRAGDRRRHPQERGVRQRRHRRRAVHRLPGLPGGRPADPRRQLLHAPPGLVLRGQLARGHQVAEDGDVFAFYLPPINEEFGNPVLGAGEFVGAFSDEPQVQAFQLYMTSEDFINNRAEGGQFIPPHSGLDTANLHQPDRRAVGRAAQRRGGDVPLRRLRPHAGCRRRRDLLVRDDRVDRRGQGRRRRPRAPSRPPGPRPDDR